MADLILLQTIITGYAALMQTIQVWQSTRDRNKAIAAFETAQTAALTDPTIVVEARSLRPVVPQDVAELIHRRFSGCWTTYYNILNPANGSSDDALDEAEESLIRCACREAKRLHDLTGGDIPDGPLRDFWERHRCWEILADT